MSSGTDAGGGWYHSDIMPNLLVRNIPSALYEALRAAAKREGRSLSAEVVVRLRKSLATRMIDWEGIEADIEKRRREAGVMDIPAVDLIREDRDR